LGQLTLNWVSPITVDTEKNSERSVVELLHSSTESWASGSVNVLPDYESYPRSGFPVEGERGSKLLAVAVEGRFESFFKDRRNPLTATAGEESTEAEGGDEPDESSEAQASIAGLIERSPESARLLVVASN